MDSRGIFRQADQLDISSLQLLVLQGRSSSSMKCTDSVPRRIATTLAFPVAPGNMDVMRGGGLVAWITPAAVTGKQRSKWSLSMKSTMKEGVEIMLGAGRGSVVARRGLEGRWRRRRTRRLYQRRVPASLPARRRRRWRGWQRRRRRRRRGAADVVAELGDEADRGEVAEPLLEVLAPPPADEQGASAERGR